MKNVSRPSNPPDESAQNVSKKIPVGRIIPPFFSSKVQNLTVFSIIYMIRIRFSGRELIQNGFRAARLRVGGKYTRSTSEAMAHGPHQGSPGKDVTLLDRARRVPLFTEWIGASTFQVILAGPSRRSSTGTLSSGTSGSRRISLILLHERIRRRIRQCHFCTLINIVTETTSVSFRTLPVGFPSPTISKNSLSTLFCPLILDHGVSFIISISGLKILVS